MCSRTGLQLSLVLAFLALGQAHTKGCSGGKDQVKVAFRQALIETPTLLPAFVRAAFHDCITVTKGKPESGCNGSLRLPKKRDNHNNDELDEVLALLDETLPGTCVSYADGIQIGQVTAMDLATNGKFPQLKIRQDIPDSDKPDTLSELPNRRANFTELQDLFARKGLPSKELIASIVGAHSLGRFFSGKEEKERNFTTTPFVFNLDFANNLVQRLDSGKNLAGFYTIPTDRNLLESAEAVRLVKFFAGRTGSGKSERYDGSKGVERLTKTFVRFLEKQSFLLGSTLKELR